MELKIENQTENPLFERKELILTTEGSATPKNLDVAKAISEKFSCPEDAVSIKRIISGFGHNLFMIYANIYPSKQVKDKVEIKNKQEKAKPSA